MLRNFIKSFRSNVPSVGDTFSGDAFFYFTGRPARKITYGLRDLRDPSKDLEEIIGPDTYRVRLLIDGLTHFVCEVSILCKGASGKKHWYVSPVRRKIQKDDLESMIRSGELKKI